jgi:hypothetical protein
MNERKKRDEYEKKKKTSERVKDTNVMKISEDTTSSLNDMCRTLWVQIIISTSQYCPIQDRIHSLIPFPNHKIKQSTSGTNMFVTENERRRKNKKTKRTDMCMCPQR